MILSKIRKSRLSMIIFKVISQIVHMPYVTIVTLAMFTFSITLVLGSYLILINNQLFVNSLSKGNEIIIYLKNFATKDSMELSGSLKSGPQIENSYLLTENMEVGVINKVVGNILNYAKFSLPKNILVIHPKIKKFTPRVLEKFLAKLKEDQRIEKMELNANLISQNHSWVNQINNFVLIFFYLSLFILLLVLYGLSYVETRLFDGKFALYEVSLLPIQFFIYGMLGTSGALYLSETLVVYLNGHYGVNSNHFGITQTIGIVFLGASIAFVGSKVALDYE